MLHVQFYYPVIHFADVMYNLDGPYKDVGHISTEPWVAKES